MWVFLLPRDGVFLHCCKTRSPRNLHSVKDRNACKPRLQWAVRNVMNTITFTANLKISNVSVVGFSQIHQQSFPANLRFTFCEFLDIHRFLWSKGCDPIVWYLLKNAPILPFCAQALRNMKLILWCHLVATWCHGATVCWSVGRSLIS